MAKIYKSFYIDDIKGGLAERQDIDRHLLDSVEISFPSTHTCAVVLDIGCTALYVIHY